MSAETSAFDDLDTDEAIASIGSDDAVREAVPQEFIPTPERVTQFLGRRTLEETKVLYDTQEGLDQLYRDLAEHEDYLQELHPGFELETLRTQLDLISETLQEERRYLEDMSQPEKKTIFRRAWDSVKGFARENPVTVGVLLTALAVASVAAGFYFTGNMELLMTTFGLDKIFGGAEAAGELIPVTPTTPPLPGGGVFTVPPPSAPLGPVIPGINTPT